MVPLISPPGAQSVSRQSYNGTSVRLIPTYDGIDLLLPPSDNSGVPQSVELTLAPFDPMVAASVPIDEVRAFRHDGLAVGRGGQRHGHRRDQRCRPDPARAERYPPPGVADG